MVSQQVLGMSITLHMMVLIAYINNTNMKQCSNLFHVTNASTVQYSFIKC
jgi:hypothetical protein